MSTTAERKRRLSRSARIAARARRRRAHPILRAASASGGIRVNMAAMIDIVFLLLIYFMLIAEFRPNESSFATAMAVPSDSAADPFLMPERPITIRVRTIGDPADASSLPGIATDSPIFGRIATLEDFETAAREARELLLDPEQEFIIVPAPSARWAHALSVVNTLHMAGYARIRLEAPGAFGVEEGIQ